ncbi:hypothetical protein ACGFNX_10665 [Streptomyces sp. NPDC048723]|uniref:hypothetical protein n=1 Tax=Streptomyces sp. NPDC048723 TaxID=3365589 RepID=UPI0037226ED5
MDETLDLLDTLLDGVTEPRLKLISAVVDGAPRLLDDTTQSEEIRRAAGEIRLLGARLA